VSPSLRVVRWSRRAPILSSKSETFRLTLDLGIFSRLAAAVKLPACTTRVNTSSSLRSTVIV